MEKRTFDAFRKLIYDKSGITLGEGKEALVSARIGKRLRALELDTPEDYLKYLSSPECDSDSEFVELLDVISTNVTSFFREPAHFDFMASFVEKMVAEGRNKIRIWCAASSSGEEPYTIAMTFLENIGGFRGDCRILATDISTRILKMAKAGEYTEQKIQGVPPQLRSRYFNVIPGANKIYKASPDIADMITFSRLNLSTPPFPMKGPFDLIFCRNVMIYFDNTVRQRLLKEFERLLRPGGYLMVGHSESLAGLQCSLDTIKPSVYHKKG
ncbi:MAG: methyltransferase domain-containing protein [Chitinispirillales bacterium]|jgi:chemotaxis protein methyltransferase CheR|nr:methyltransferase domain-containing protein [Chitinispirillales bacterium]